MIPDGPRASGGRGEGGHFSFEKRSVPPRPPKRNPGGFRISTPSRHCDSRPLFGAANRAASSKQARFIRHWRRFACFPHTPLKRLKGAGLRPLPFGFPSREWTGERVAKRGARKEEQSPCVNRPGKMRPRLQMRGIRSLFLGGTAHSAEAWQVSAAWIRTTPVFKQKRRQRRRFAPKRLFLPPCTAHSFSARRKRMGGASPRPGPVGRHSPRPRAVLVPPSGTSSRA